MYIKKLRSYRDVLRANLKEHCWVFLRSSLTTFLLAKLLLWLEEGVGQPVVNIILFMIGFKKETCDCIRNHIWGIIWVMLRTAWVYIYRAIKAILTWFRPREIESIWRHYLIIWYKEECVDGIHGKDCYLFYSLDWLTKFRLRTTIIG